MTQQQDGGKIIITSLFFWEFMLFPIVTDTHQMFRAAVLLLFTEWNTGSKVKCHISHLEVDWMVYALLGTVNSLSHYFYT